MKRSSNPLVREDDGGVPPEKRIQTHSTVIPQALVGSVTSGSAHVVSPVLGMEAVMPNDTLVNSDIMQLQDASSASAIMNEHQSDGSTGEVFFCQQMDITEPLTTLRCLLEQRVNTSLEGYQFFLQDSQQLDASKNLVNQCVQGEGLVQINVEISNDLKKINIVDVLKPAEEIVVTPDTTQGDKVGEPPVVRKVVIPVTEEAEQITRWVVSPEYRQEQERLKIPSEPLNWTQDHVQHWIKWAVQQFNLQGVNMDTWNITGKELSELSHADFVKKVPYDPGDFFWTHLELLRKCKFVAVIQQPAYVQPFTQGFTITKSINMKNRLRSPKIGAPRVAYEGCPGNRTGNNGQIQLWQFLLELLTDKDQREYIQWVGDDGEFKLNNPEMVAHLWGQRKNKPTMNYEKLSRALRYYYDGDMIAKVHGKRFVYKFVCDLKSLLGYDAAELNRLVMESEQKKLEKIQNTIVPFSTVEVTALGASSHSIENKTDS